MFFKPFRILQSSILIGYLSLFIFNLVNAKDNNDTVKNTETSISELVNLKKHENKITYHNRHGEKGSIYFTDENLDRLTKEYFSKIEVNNLKLHRFKKLFPEAKIEYSSNSNRTFKDVLDAIISLINDQPAEFCSICNKCNHESKTCHKVCTDSCHTKECPICPIPDWCPEPDLTNACPSPPRCPDCARILALNPHLAGKAFRVSKELIEAGDGSNNETDSKKREPTFFYDISNLLGPLIDLIPESVAGGIHSNLGSKIIDQLGGLENAPGDYFNMYLGRSFTYRTARRNSKVIVDEILDRIIRIRCGCELCDSIRPCNCKPSIQCSFWDGKCPICPFSLCPVPDNCQQYPACPECHILKTNLPYSEMDNVVLDDLDPYLLIDPKEFTQDVPCKSTLACKFQSDCGKAPLNPLTPRKDKGYMNGGENAIYGEWPSFVRLDIMREEGTALCGGVLISDRHVLTAGHCFNGSKDGSRARVKPHLVKVVLGDHNRRLTDEHEIIRHGKEICISSRYNDPHDIGSRYDYSVLELDSPVNLNDYISPACLPYNITDSDDSHCYVVGIGITKFDSFIGLHQFSQVLQKMRLKRVSCYQWGFSDSDRSRYCFTKASGPGDTCGGDSGGPVLCLNKHKKWTVVGTVSYGLEGCDGTGTVGWTGVYSRTPQLMKYIQEDCGI